MIENKELIKIVYRILASNEAELILDKKKRLYFAGTNFTINLIPQALLLLGLLGRKIV